MDAYLNLKSTNVQASGERFATLLNLPLVKYVVGSFFPGHRENEEFIFCRNSCVDSTHCEISVGTEGHFWIRKSTVSAATYINLRLLKDEPIKLCQGDVISLGIPLMNQNDRNFAVFQFNFLVNPVGVEDVSATTSLPTVGTSEEVEKVIPEKILENPVILPIILQEFSLAELKELRLLSSSWSDFVFTFMQKRALVYFKFNDYEGNEGTRIFRYCHEMSGKPLLTGLELNLPTFYNSELDPTFVFTSITDDSDLIKPRSAINTARGQPGEKLLLDLTTLLNFHQESVKYLGFNGNIKSNLDFEVMESVFENVSGSVTHLKLDLGIFNLPQTFKNVKNLSFKKLKTLEPSFKYVDDQFFNRGEEMGKWANQMLALIGNLNSLEAIIFPTFISDNKFLEKITQLNFPNLSSISFSGIEHNGLADLLKLPLRPLVNLDLGETKGLNSNEKMLLLEEVISKNSSTLKHFSLHIPYAHRTVIFPNFPLLVSFKLVYGSICCTKVGFEPLGYVDYKASFPVLRRLWLRPDVQLPEYDNDRHPRYDFSPSATSFGPGYYCEYRPQIYRKHTEFECFPRKSFSEVLSFWRLNQQVFNTFFSFESGQSCKTLESLGIFHVDPSICKVNAPAEYLEKTLKMKEIFPMVRGSWISGEVEGEEVEETDGVGLPWPRCHHDLG